VRSVADGESAEIGVCGQLPCYLGDDVWKQRRGLDIEAELALFAHKPEDHGGAGASVWKFESVVEL
jgi:hypothetical protein